MEGSDKTETKTPNSLIREKSPYLLQHAYNPVNWHPWSKVALQLAMKNNKPIFLSIGFSTCHWCHVMARESFESEQTAGILNENFICIKVDREERPDLDEIYMKAVQILAGTGGWPLSVFLTPDGKPFYGGTYFPPRPVRDLPAFNDVLQTIVTFWHENRDQLQRSSEDVTELLQKSYLHKPHSGEVSVDLLDDLYAQLVLQFDPAYGGFGADVAAWSVKRPKFPLPCYLSFLLRYHHRTGEKSALTMVTQTLHAMARGGIFDQLGGGFHRYSTDRHWLVPHFEKMLYDNALLSRVYLEAYQVTGDPIFARIGKETLDWVLREMAYPDGGFYSAIDADSEGVEGAFYVWSPDEVRSVLGAERGEAICRYFGVTPQGNFEGGKSVLHKAEPEPSAAAEREDTIRDATLELLLARNRRIRPATDDKILTGLNGLMIRAFATGYRVLHEKRFLEAATSSARFILDNLVKKGRLCRRYRDSEATIPGTLEDYAFFSAALLDLYEASFNPEWLREAFRLNDAMIELFWDDADGGFFFNRHGEIEILTSIKEAYDGPVPSGNSIATENLLRIGALADDEDMRRRARDIFHAFGAQLEESPLSHTQMLSAVDLYLNSAMQIVIACNDVEDTSEFVDEINRHFLPDKVIAFTGSRADDEVGSGLVPLTKDKVAIQGKPTVYICENYTCRDPITELEDLRQVLSRHR
ncbi:MAG: thioredoxin domain-containing protein [Euryarchaeota archaeon]|nr:thioredoxin domain-containing protein [Euryarchaeota archaeon]